MQINVKGHQVDVTPALHDYVTSKFERVTRHYDHLHELNVVLGVEKLLHKAEATIQCEAWIDLPVAGVWTQQPFFRAMDATGP